MTAVRRVVVYDFDGTLVRGDSGDAFMRWLLARDWRRRLAAFAVAPVGLPMLLWPRMRRRGVSLFLWLATVGLDDRAFEDALREFCAVHRIRPIEPVLQCLVRDVAAGHRVVIATGALEGLAMHLLGQLDLATPPELVGSTMERFAGGYVVGVQANGRAKLRRLALAGIHPPFDQAYSDSASDLPLLAASVERVLVASNPALIARIRARLHPAEAAVMADD